MFVSERKAPLTTDAVRKITSVRDNGSREAAMEIKGKRGFLGLMTVSGKACEQMDEEIERTTVT